MKEYTSENPIFYDKINMVERADLVNDQNKNESAKQLLQNTLVLKKQLDTCLGENGKNGKLELADGINADDLVGAINEVFMLGSKIKDKLAGNLTAIGITSSADETMEQLLGKVLDAVDTSGDTVTAAVLLTGYTAHDLTGEQITGGMADNGAWTGNTSGSGNVAIPKGYHNGRGYVAGQGAYDKGVADADARTNPNSANYQNGYSAGVSSMDGTIADKNNQINNLNSQITDKSNTINDLNSQIANKNNQIDNLNQELENLRNKAIVFDSYDNGFKIDASCSGSGRPASGQSSQNIDNSQLKLRYCQCKGIDGSWWDLGDGGIKVNDHTLYAIEKGYKNGVGYYQTTTTDAHIYDLGANPPDTITIVAWANGGSAGGSDTGTVRTTGTISFWR